MYRPDRLQPESPATDTVHWPLLLKAATVIRKRGWCKYSYGLDGGPVCIVGAVLAVNAAVNAGEGALRHLNN